MDLTTHYLGLDLKNPFVVGACPLTMTAESIRECANAGAGAVVLKSLFEEQIRAANCAVGDSLAEEGTWHTEVFDYLEAEIGMRYGTREYLELIRQAKAEVDIPIIASINCLSADWWLDFALEAQAAGADAVELNIAVLPMELKSTSADIEDRYEHIVRRTVEALRVPVAVKLPPYFSAPGAVVLRLREAGAAGFVLFNRLYRPTVDIASLRLCVTENERYSTPGELSPSLRWISLVADRVAADFAAATGVHSGADLVRSLLVGANTVQCVSVLMKHGTRQIRRMLRDLETWMTQQGHERIEEFRGKLSQAANPEQELFGRVQYIQGLLGADEQ